MNNIMMKFLTNNWEYILVMPIILKAIGFILKTLVVIVNFRFYKVHSYSITYASGRKEGLNEDRIGLVDISILLFQGSFTSRREVDRSDLERIMKKLNLL